MSWREEPHLETEARTAMAAGAADLDPLLAGIHAARRNPAAAETAIQAAMTGHALPLVRDLLRSWVGRGGLTAGEVPDLEGEVALRLMRTLRRLSEDPHAEPIARFADYVDATVHHAIDDWRRRRHPLLNRLALRVRYVLTHTRSLAVWGREPVLCGAAEWRDHGAPVPPAPVRADRVGPADDARALRHLVEDVLRRSGGPVAVEELVDALAVALHVPVQPFVSSRVLAERPHAVEPLARLEGRQYVERLWMEIAALPVRQRRALLLQLQLDDGESVARLLPALGIAGVRTLAATLEMPLEELLALWNELPLGDKRIANMLSITRQQVINLRKSARERLARRMGRARKS